MQNVIDMDLPTLPVEQPEFSARPMPCVDAARAQHPWLAKFEAGYIIHGYQAAKDILYMDDKLSVHFEGLVEHFGAQGTQWARFMSEILPTVSGAKHDRLRASVAQAFTPRSANRTRPAMREVISELLEEWSPKREFDFADFASYFPVTVMCGILGISSDPIPGIRQALENQVAVMSRNKDLLPKILEGYELMSGVADQVIREREQCGKTDPASLLDALIACKNSGSMDETELRDMLLVLLLGGYDTSKNMLTLMMYILLDHPDMWQQCAKDREYCKKVVDEALRHSTILTPYRLITDDIEYEGIRFPKGVTLCFALSLTGRDPSAFPAPMEFRPDREQKPHHIAFGRGAHICLGQYIAKAQLEEGVHLIAQRLKDPQLAGEVTWRPFLGAWGLRTLPVKFTPASAR